MNPYFNNAPVGKIFINRAKNVILKQHKGPRDGEINQVFSEALARVDEGKQTPERRLEAGPRPSATRPPTPERAARHCWHDQTRPNPEADSTG